MNDDYLWKQVTKDVKPIKDNNKVKAELPPYKPPRYYQEYTPKESMSPKKQPEIEYKKGTFSYDSKIDLHGMTLQEAYIRLYQFIIRSYDNHLRRLIIITGHGEGESTIKREFEFWMEKPKFSKFVSSYKPAHRRQGGDGAYYVMLRKNPTTSRMSW